MTNNLTKQFIKYKIPKTHESMEHFCLPKKFKLQPQQILLPEILSSKYSPWMDDVRGILLYHQIGAGKTCTSINIAEKFKKYMKIIVVLPASLIGNYYCELRSECTENQYVTKKERNKLKNLNYDNPEYVKIIKLINMRINQYYTIYSYHKFVQLIQNNKIKILNNTLLIIDEIQNMISLNGTFYNSLNKVIDASNNTLKILLLSATPIFDKPIEIALTLNLLKIKNKFSINKFNQTYLEVNKGNYKIINIKDFRNNIKNLISYYRGAPPQAYPEYKIKTIKCKMNDFQYKSYLNSLSTENNYLKGAFKSIDILNMPRNFFLGPRIISNIAFPNKSIGDTGFKSFTKEHLQFKNIINYSSKFYKIINKINQSYGPVFIYSNFKDIGGIKSIVKVLEYHGWKNFAYHNKGTKRFAIWSGDESLQLKENIKCVFNDKKNYDGSLIKIILGSPSIKEGVSLLRVEQVHILEPYWNMSRMLQIMGRAIRFCSHKDLPKDRRYVNVYIYLATSDKDKTIDQYIWSLAKKKHILIQQFEKILKESAFDCELFYNRNSYSDDKIKLKCHKY